MTQKQIYEARRALPHILTWETMTKEDQLKHDELDCREMINSCLAYGQLATNFYDAYTNKFGRYAETYIRKLGKERVKQLANEQLESFNSAAVDVGCYTDHEGCSYNRIIWEDDKN